MPQVKQSCYIESTIQRVWRALTDESVLNQWAGPARMDLKAGGEFSLWGNDVHGTNTKIVPNELLQQDWYGDDNPERKYDVTFSLGFDDYRGQVILTVTHSAGDDDFKSMSDGWRQYYFEPIKKLLETPQQDQVSSQLKLVEKQQLIDNVWAFRFKPDEPLTWIPGQYMWVELKHDNPDSEGTRRWFSVSSAPYEGVIQITTRVTNTTFKQALSKLPIGGTIDLLVKPDGDFVWQESDLPLTFVAGGIGVTPFYGMLKQRAHEKLPLSVTLIYGSRDGKVPFKDELAAWSKQDAGLKVLYPTGQMTAETLAGLLPNLNKTLVYVSGPEPMVKALCDDLLKHGLPQSQLRRDEFPNYDQHNY